MQTDPESKVTAIHQTELGSGNLNVVRQDPPSTDVLRGSYSAQGPIVVESTTSPVTLRSLDFYAEFGSRIVGGQAAPFQTVLHDSGDRWMLSLIHI